MTDAPEPTHDLVPPASRLTFYVISAIAGPSIFAVAGILALWVPEYKDQFNGTAVLLSSALAGICGGLGIAYRPHQ